MDTEQLIDEIDWLISEMCGGLEITPEHNDSLMAAGIDCRQKILSRASASHMIEILKNKREELL